jgi:pSer/pThr/pTyr-binding forkhead associated (FHA) protein
MAYLFVLNGRERCRAFHLNKDEQAIGQRDDADFVLKDPWISWNHARVVKEGEDFAIEDLGSTNGTYVDCVKIQRQTLRDDDVVFLGRTHLLFVASNRPPSAPPPPRPRDPAAERWAGTDRLSRQADEIDVRPVLSDERVAIAPPDSGPIEFRGPLDDLGRIEELDEVGREPDAEAFLPSMPPVDPAAGAVVIDVADLLDSDGQIVAAAAPEDSGLDWAASSAAPAGEPLEDAAAEVERLRAVLASRDAEIRRLREELQKLKEQYLDL